MTQPMGFRETFEFHGRTAEQFKALKEALKRKHYHAFHVDDDDRYKLMYGNGTKIDVIDREDGSTLRVGYEFERYVEDSPATILARENYEQMNRQCYHELGEIHILRASMWSLQVMGWMVVVCAVIILLKTVFF